MIRVGVIALIYLLLLSCNKDSKIHYTLALPFDPDIVYEGGEKVYLNDSLIGRVRGQFFQDSILFFPVYLHTEHGIPFSSSFSVKQDIVFYKSFCFKSQSKPVTAPFYPSGDTIWIKEYQLGWQDSTLIGKDSIGLPDPETIDSIANELLDIFDSLDQKDGLDL